MLKKSLESIVTDDIEDLIARIIERDEDAFHDLYEATFSKVYSLALKITKDPSTAEEVVEDTYYQIWQEIYRYDFNKCPLYNWMLIICRSRAIDAVRKQNAIPEMVVNYDWVIESTELSADDRLQSKQNSIAVIKALSEIKPLQRQLLHHVFYYGLTHQEISVIMNMPLGSVKSTINRAQKLLREKLKGEQF
jgi:RNA polymerase sigma-70 factor (ECF subfamily)